MLVTLFKRNFTLLWLGGLISVMGDWVLNVGLPIYVYLLTHSVFALSIILIVVSLPNILLGSVAGVFVDRWNRKRTMVVANVLLALALLPLLLATRPDRVWIVYVVALVESCLEQFVTPAQNALLPSLVDKSHLVAANSLNALSANLARLVGPAIGGVVAAIYGLRGIVLADAASFAIAAALFTLIAVAAGARPTPEASLPAAEVGAVARVWRDWADGLRVLFSERALWVLLLLFAITSLGEGVFGVLYPIFVYRVLHGGALQIGELMSAQAVGGLIGGVLVGWAGSRVMSRWAIGMCLLAFGLVDLAIFNTPAFFPFFGLSAGLFVAAGLVGIGAPTGGRSLLQARTPEAYLGRVFGALGATMGLLLLVGTVIAGTLTDHLGLIPVLNLQGMGYVVAGLLGLVLLPRPRPAPASQAAEVAHAADAASPASVPADQHTSPHGA